MVKSRDPQIVALDNLSLAFLNILSLKAKAGAEIMNKIALRAANCGRPWTDDLIRHQRAILRGATVDVLVCAQCFQAVKVGKLVGNLN